MTDTGLPELPEGYFWRVKAQSVEIRQSLPDTEWRRRPEYSWLDTFDYGYDDGKRETRTVQVTRKTENQVRKWFRKVTVEGEETYAAAEDRYIERSCVISEAQTEKNGETTRTPGRHHPATYRSRYEGYYYSYMGRDLVTPGYTEPDRVIEHRHPVTRENIISVCERALEKFNARQLIGDYPPKKLEQA